MLCLGFWNWELCPVFSPSQDAGTPPKSFLMPRFSPSSSFALTLSARPRSPFQVLAWFGCTYICRGNFSNFQYLSGWC